MTSLLTAQAKASAKILSFASPAIHHLVDSGFCSCITPWRRQLKTVALSQRALKSFRIANHKSLRIGKRFLAVKKDTGEKEVCYNRTLIYVTSDRSDLDRFPPKEKQGDLAKTGS